MKKIYLLIFILFSLFSKAQLNAIWANSIGSTVAELGEAIAVDPSTGDVYVAGTFSSTVDFDPSAGVTNLTTINAEDIFLAKYSSGGAFLWVKPVGGSASQIVYDLKADATGVYMVGSFNGPTDFDNNSSTAATLPVGASDGFIEKFNTSGIMQWLVKIQAGGFDRVTALTIDASQNVFVTGFLGGVADMDPSAATVNLSPTVTPGAFFAKYTSAGAYAFAKLINGQSEGNDIALNGSGEVYITGSFSQTTDFDPSATTATLASAGIGDIFLARFDASGNYLFAEQMGGTGNDLGTQIEIDVSGSVYLGGNFNGTGDFDPSASNYPLTSTGGSEMFLSKYTSAGALLWAESVGGTGSDNLTGMVVNTSSDLYVTGSFAGIVDFDPGASQFNLAGGGASAFLAHYNSSGVFMYAGYTGVSNSEGRGLAIGTDLYFTGYFAGTADLDLSPSTATLTSNGNIDIFFAKYAICSGTLPAQSSAISCNTIACTGTAASYSVINDPAVTNYFWSTPPSWTVSGTTNSVNLTSYTTGIIYVYPTNTCGAGPASSVAVSVGGFDNSTYCNYTQPSCYGGSNGSATVYPVGGVSPFTYTWIPSNQTTSVSTNIASGINTVIITDSYGCSIQKTVNVIQPPALTLTNPTITNVACNSASTGVMGATAGGGTPGYSYLWQTSNSFTPAPFYFNANVPAGSYTFILTDAKSCTLAMPFTITQPSLPIIVVSTATTAACNFSAMGSSTVLFSGGVNPYTYSWTSSSQTTNTLTNVNVGSYSITCVDAAGCVKKQLITIPYAQTPTVVVSPITSSICSGQTVTLTATGATTYTWNATTVSNSITDVPGSTTVYSVTGENNTCFNSKTATVNVTPSPTVLVTASTNTTCAGGSITLTASSASSYTWNNTSSNSTVIVVNPTVSTVYTLTGQSGLCSDTAITSINVFSLPTITFSTSDTILCAGQSATITVNGASTYTWSDNSNSNPYIVNPSSTVIYTITGKDNNGCVNTAVFTQSVSTCTGIQSIAEIKVFEVYPNPFSNELTLILEGDVKLEIFNTIGQRIHNEDLKAGKQKIDTRSLPAGIYYIKFNDHKAIKLIKQ